MGETGKALVRTTTNYVGLVMTLIAGLTLLFVVTTVGIFGFIGFASSINWLFCDAFGWMG